MIRCRACGRRGHNVRTCRRANHCSVCGRALHNARTCPQARRCSWCLSTKHNRQTCWKRIGGLPQVPPPASVREDREAAREARRREAVLRAKREARFERVRERLRQTEAEGRARWDKLERKDVPQTDSGDRINPK